MGRLFRGLRGGRRREGGDGRPPISRDGVPLPPAIPGEPDGRPPFSKPDGALKGPESYPPELRRRVQLIEHKKTRKAVEILINDGLPEKKIGRSIRDKERNSDFVIHKFGDRRKAFEEFIAVVRQSGGATANVEFIEPGVLVYKAPDGTRIVYRKISRKGESTNEITVLRKKPNKNIRIKIRYRG
jgi:hypothetical protein